MLKHILPVGLVLVSSVPLMAETGRFHEDQQISVHEKLDKFAQGYEKEISVVDNLRRMVSDGKVSGQFKSMYAGYFREGDNPNEYATAIGGMLKYELAEYNGFNAAAAFTTSQDLDFATGEDTKHNTELSSDTQEYTELTEAYINYRNGNLNLRAGLQVINTPLADSDNIRMVQNTFEAYIATYYVDNFEFFAGHLMKWQGVDAGLKHGEWVNVGSKGAYVSGITYTYDVQINAWYYNFIDLTNAVYLDIAYTFDITKDFSIDTAAQYLNESEIGVSNAEAEIYGALAGFSVYNIGFELAYNISNKKVGKHSHSGNGGGTLFTSMDTMILDEIADDREARAILASVSREWNLLNFLYAYGDFKGKENSLGEKAHIVEHNIGCEYEWKEDFFLGAIYVIQEDKEDSSNDWSRLQLMVAYNF
ncbi:OprD family outer membrane porin [Candidatus Sulfurimonas baltica]|uniref:Outer membrane porin, OprD family n=1 Tax=Candidatus Sulfurimonas baltica TaxID=2740404 RepID=A0A7S7LW28_9BACT|nr:OprD family outer membrane porin [Candidatus Sulfurimonas baltica]QOY52431.1 outer membrane porin, OprD family [Candidatus Sulfurimonas baltica]